MANLAHKIELTPTPSQEVYFRKACGVARFSYNWALQEWDRQYKAGGKPHKYGLIKLQNSLKDSDWPWMREVTKCAPQYAIHNLQSAFTRFFKDSKKPVGQRHFKYPRPKKKGRHDSFRVAEQARDIELSGYRIRLPRIGWIKMCEELRFKGKILFVTVSRIAYKWFATFTVETEVKLIARENQSAVGVDLGVKNLAILSDGTVFENPKALRRNLVKLKRLQRSLSRKVKGSSNRRKARMKVARLHYRIGCIRKDALHRVTTHLVRNYCLVGAESLHVSGMLKNRKLSRAIQDAGLGEFRRQLQYKSELYGSRVVWADQWFPSSKLCSECGCLKDSLTLIERSWKCLECGAEHDRDVNAARNLKILAEKSSVTACGEIVSLESIKRTSVKQEAYSRKVG